MIHTICLVWVFSVLLALGQAGAGWDLYALLGVTATMFYLMGSEDGAN